MSIDRAIELDFDTSSRSPALRSSATSIDLALDQPIAALASPPGSAARGIVRISGPRVKSVLEQWFEPDDLKSWSQARRASSHAGRLRFGGYAQPVACPVQVLLWPDSRSYTGQPLVELHLPGSPCLLEAVLSEVYRQGARPARPGEFTLRAFLAGKLDLIQAEAVLGVIDAHDHLELQTALSQLAGGISSRLAELRGQLLELLADLEAGLDFIEEDIEFVSRSEVVTRLRQAQQTVSGLLQQSSERMHSSVRPRVVLAGLPNAGKSTLFNRLAGGSAALVSSERGTTRDFLIQSVDWLGLSFDLIDTAGWEDHCTGIAAVAQQQRVEQLRQADLLVWCSSVVQELSEREVDGVLFNQARSESRQAVRAVTKIDLDPDFQLRDDSKADVVRISVKEGLGFAQLEAALKSGLSQGSGKGRQWLGMTAARCRSTLESLSASVQHALTSAETDSAGDELIAVDLRQALDDLGVILGVTYTDDILDRVFSKFCIGK